MGKTCKEISNPDTCMGFTYTLISNPDTCMGFTYTLKVTNFFTCFTHVSILSSMHRKHHSTTTLWYVTTIGSKLANKGKAIVLAVGMAVPLLDWL